MSCIKALSSDLGNMFLDPQFSDIVLLCQEEEIQAHKMILSARSPLFRAMLKTEMPGSVKGEIMIMIENADKDVLKEMVGYFYTAKVGEHFTKYKELLILANKYEVEELKKFCGTKVIELLNNDNVLQVGTFAELHNAEDLMKACVKYIVVNKPSSLNQSLEEDLVKRSPKMMIEMIRQLLKKTPEKRKKKKNIFETTDTANNSIIADNIVVSNLTDVGAEAEVATEATTCKIGDNATEPVNDDFKLNDVRDNALVNEYAYPPITTCQEDIFLAKHISDNIQNI